MRPLVEMVEILTHTLLPLLNACHAIHAHFLELDRRVKHAARRDQVCLRMMMVPGVGLIAADLQGRGGRSGTVQDVTDRGRVLPDETMAFGNAGLVARAVEIFRRPSE